MIPSLRARRARQSRTIDIKYLNNIVKQDHRFIKKIIKHMMGFKLFESAQVTLAGIELHHMLRKKQHTNSEATSVVKQFYLLAA